METATQPDPGITDVRVLAGLPIGREGLAKELILLGDEAHIETDEDVSAIVDHLTRITAVTKELESERKERQRVLLEGIGTVNATYKVLSDSLGAVKAKLQGLLKDYQEKQERKAREAAEAIRKRLEDERIAEAARIEDERIVAEAEAKRLEDAGNAAEAEIQRQEAALKAAEAETALQEAADAPQPAPYQPPPMQGNYGGSASTRTTWTWEVEDEAKIPREFFILDEKQIGALVRAGRRGIPGLRIFSTTTIVGRK